jgi:hypothetical protein
VLLAVLVGAGVVILLLECVAIVRSLRSDSAGLFPPSRGVAPLAAPAELPAKGALVRSVVEADGSVEVTQWIRSGDSIGEITLSAPEGAADAAVRATDGRIVAADGTILADHLAVDAAPKRVRFANPTTLVRATYVLRGAVVSSDSVDGRLLARVVALDLDFPAQGGPTVVVVAAGGTGGEVRNLACVNARSPVALMRPCGAPDGSRWLVRLPPESRTDRVTAQVDLS